MKTKPNSTRQLVLPFMFQYFHPTGDEAVLKSATAATRPPTVFGGLNGRVIPEQDWCGGAIFAYKFDSVGRKLVAPTISLDDQGRPKLVRGLDHGMPGSVHETIPGDDDDTLPF